MGYLNLNNGDRLPIQRAAPKVHDGQELARKKKRWDPVTEGRRAVATVTIVRDKNGAIEWRQPGKARWFTLLFTLEGSLNGRRIYERILTEGAPSHVIEAGKRMMLSILSCHHNPIPAKRTVGMVDGLKVPVQVYVAKRFGDEKPVNQVHVLSPDPAHPRFRDYVELIKNQGMHVPGWNLFPDHPRVARLIARRHMQEDVVVERVTEDGEVKPEVVGQRIVPSVERQLARAAASERTFTKMANGDLVCSGIIYTQEDVDWIEAQRNAPPPEPVAPTATNGLVWKQTFAESIRGTPENLAWFARHRLRPDFSSLDDADQHVRDWRAQLPKPVKKEFK